jgi:hypothetical protein
MDGAASLVVVQRWASAQPQTRYLIPGPTERDPLECAAAGVVYIQIRRQ